MASASPEQIQALVELLRAAGVSSAPNAEPTSVLLRPELLKAWAELLASIAWPIVGLIAIVAFRKPLAQLVLEADTLKGFGWQITRRKLSKELRASGDEAANRIGLSGPPTVHELERAGAVRELVERADSRLVRQEADALAREYETVRASLPSGDERTRRMEVVFAKMRTIGRAIFAFRHEYMASAQPGHRLLAIAALQVLPDYEALDWLAERIRSEKPFVGYHAAVALNVAARNPAARAHKEELNLALQRALAFAEPLPTNSDRVKMLRDAESILSQMNQARRRA